MRAWRFNTIATRMAVTIILAIILGIALEVVIGFSVARFASRPGTRIIAPGSGAFIFNARREPIFVFNTGPNPEMLASRIAAVANFIESVPDEASLSQILTAASRPSLQLAVRTSPLSDLVNSHSGDLDLLRQLIGFELDDRSRPITIGMYHSTDQNIIGDGTGRSLSAPDRGTLFVERELPDGRWLFVSVPGYAADTVKIVSSTRVAMVISPLFMLIGLLSVLAAQQLATPIRKFAMAAERLGVDTGAPPLPERGPYELRVATRAFNRMQERLRRFVDDRTQMLAAISHDLRTPLNRLRLRAEFMEDKEQQEKMVADLEAMNTMIDSTLAFARDDAQRESRRLVDLSVLVEDVCEDAIEAGGAVSYSGPRGVNIYCRPIAISRAVANLVDNAVKYAGAAQISLVCERERVIIAVEDDGPGIPESEREKVFVPFYRLERSRNPDTGGVGLGLSVARTIAREHGGDVTLANRNGGGLSARMELPALEDRITAVSDSRGVASARAAQLYR